MTEKRNRCPLSGIYCDECGILQDPDLEYCPINAFIEALQKLSEKEE